MTRCKTCHLVARRDIGAAPLWDQIYRADHWDVAHSYDTSLLGWLVLVARRHREAIHELSAAEATELGPLIRHVSRALHALTGCQKTYVIQFAESAEHPHVHFHVMPRMADQPESHRSVHVFRYLGVPNDERVSEARITAFAAQARAHLQDALHQEG